MLQQKAARLLETKINKFTGMKTAAKALKKDRQFRYKPTSSPTSYPAASW